MGDDNTSLGEASGEVKETSGQTPVENPEPNPEKTPDKEGQTPLNQAEILEIFAGLSTEKGRLVKETEEARRVKEEYISKNRELDEAIKNAVKDDPSKLSLVELQQKARAGMEALNAEREKLESDKKAWETERSELMAFKTEKAINTISVKYGVPIDTLKKIGITDIETLERIAIYLKPNQQPKIDSGKSIGGDTDKEFLKRWNAGKEPATSANITRARNIILKEK